MEVSSGGKLRIRRALTATLLALLTALGTSGCNFTSPVASLEMYAPSDGAQADLGNVKARNLIYFVDNQGNYGFFGAFVNSSTTEETFNLGFQTKSGERVFQQYSAAGLDVVNLGYQNEPPLKVSFTPRLSAKNKLASTASAITSPSAKLSDSPPISPA